MRYYGGKGLLEVMARLRHNSGWETYINIMDMEYSEDSQTQKLHADSTNREGPCPSVG